MFMKRKTRAVKAYAYRMLLTFKRWATDKKRKLTTRQTTVSVVKQLSLDITQFFAANFLMYGASIQA